MSDTSSSKALKSGVWYTISNFIVRAASFLSMPIFTRLLTTDEIGAFSNILSWVSILTVITTFDLFNSVTIARFDFRDELDEYISSNLVLGSIITAFFYLFSLIFKKQVLKILSINEYSLHLIFLYCLFYPAMQMFQIKSRCFYKYKISVFVSISSVFFSVLASLLLVIFSTDKLWGRTIGYFVPLIIYGIVIYIYLFTLFPKISSKYWKYALKICIPLIWHTLAGVLLSSSDRVMITKICGETANAFYSVAYSCSLIVSVLWTSMNTAWSPWAYEMMDKKKYLLIRKSSRPYSILFSIVVFGFMLVAPEVLMIIGGKTYIAAVAVMPPVMAGYIFQFIYSFYVNIEFYYKKQSFIAICTVGSAIINIVLNYLLIPRFGYIAAAYTTLIGYIALFLFHFIIVYKMGKSSWYDTKFNLCLLIIFMIFMPSCIWLYDHIIIRWVMIIFICLGIIILLIKKKNVLKDIIKKKSIAPLMDTLER